ncbi:MAG TPA: hypothetical protein VGB45_12980 [Abditibacterium sp.]|jgi:hypothetical protein
MPIFGFPFFNGFELFSLAGLIVAATAIIHIFFALGIKRAAEKRLRDHQTLLFAPPWVWALAVLVSGLPFLVTYWLFHHAFERAKE